jgi:CHAT domain-containing protein/Tfp pilus assembly protein PilF
VLCWIAALAATPDVDDFDKEDFACGLSEGGRLTFRELSMNRTCVLLAWLFVFAATLSIPLVQAQTLPTEKELAAEQQVQLNDARQLNNRVIELYGKGDFRQAVPLAKQVLSVRESVLGPEHQDVAEALNNLSMLLSAQTAFGEARPYLERALKIQRQVWGEEHRHTATALNNLGQLLYRQGEYATAQQRFEEALQIRRKVLGEEHLATATSLNDLGFVLNVQRDYAAARPYMEQALRIQRKLLGEEHPDVAISLNNLGMLLEALGQSTAAREHYGQALQIQRRLYGDEHLGMAASLNNLGLLLQRQGDLAAARPYLEQALKVHKKAFGEEHPDTATSFSNLATLLLEQGDYQAARRYAEQSLNIRRKVLGEDHPDTGRSFNNLGMVLQAQVDYEGARPYLEQALRIWRKAVGEKHPDTAAAIDNLGGLLYHQGDYASARDYFEQALKIKRKVLGEQHPETATSLNNLGLARKAQGDHAAARDCYQQALAIFRNTRGEEHPATTSSVNNLALLEAASGNWEIARVLTHRCRQSSRQHITHLLPALSDREQLAFLQSKEHDFHVALSMARVRAMDSGVPEISAGWLVNGKGMAQEALSARALLTRDAANPKLAQTVQDLGEVRAQLARLAMSAMKQGQEQARRETFDRLTAEEQKLSRDLAAATGLAVTAGTWIEIETVRKAIPANSVLIEIARFDVFNFQAKDKGKNWQPAHYAVWIVPPAGQGDVQIVDLGSAEAIEKAIEQARTTLAATPSKDSVLRRDGEQAAEALARRDLAQIADLVWRPLAEKLGSAKRLILSPDGALWLLPWGALPIGNDQYLIEKYSLQFVISGRDVLNHDVSKLPTTDPVLFADPDFDLSAAESRAAVKAVLPDLKLDASDFTRGSLAAKSTLPRVRRLPHTALEAQAAAKNIESLAGAKPLSYTERYALESIAKRVHRPRVLLFATHGFFLPDQDVKREEQPISTNNVGSARLLTVDGKPIENPLLRCGLLLAGCNSNSTEGDDGVLSGLEIVGLDLRGTELVVLSACETGIGKVRNGEGVAGLRQAFQLAGAETVVSTLWEVPDRDSALIMDEFFANLANAQTNAEALRKSQLKRIAARREKFGAAHPFFWAAWTVTGQ